MTEVEHGVDGPICQARDDKSARRPSDPPGIDARAVGAEGVPRIDRLIVNYAAGPGRDLDRPRFWTALSHWKLAIVIEGVYRRWLEDPANGGEDAGELRPRADAMAEPALLTLEER